MRTGPAVVRCAFVSLVVLGAMTPTQTEAQPPDSAFRDVAGCSACEVINVRSQGSPPAFWTAKMRDPASGQFYRVTINDVFHEYYDDEIRRELLIEQKLNHGKMDERLSDLVAKDPFDTFGVTIWAAVDMDRPERDVMLALPAVEAQWREALDATLSSTLGEIAEAIVGLDGEIVSSASHFPMIQARLRGDALLQLQENPLVERLILGGWGDSCRPLADNYWWHQVCGFDVANQYSQGAGVEVVLMEPKAPMWEEEIPASLGVRDPSGPRDEHASLVAAILSHETAPDAAHDVGIYFNNMAFCDHWDWTLERRPSLTNSSFTCGDEVPTPSPDVADKAHDWLAATGFILPVVAAGNSGGLVGNKPYNALTVGASSDGAWPGVAGFSAWEEPEHPYSFQDRELPEVIAPGVGLEVAGRTSVDMDPNDWWGPQDISGTSIAAPQVTAAAALLIDLSPGLRWRPEAVKAILMATAGSIESPWLDLQDGVDDRDGTGHLDAENASQLARDNPEPAKGADALQSGYAAGSISLGSRSFDLVNRDTYSAGYLRSSWKAAVAGSNGLRVALTWLANPGCERTDEGELDCDAWKPTADLDLEIISPSGRRFYSASFENTYEYVHVPYDDSEEGEWEIRVFMTKSAGAHTEFGLAWWVGGL